MGETITERVKKLYRHVRRHTSTKPGRFEMSQENFDTLYAEWWGSSGAGRCPCKRDVFASTGCSACDDSGTLPVPPFPDGAIFAAHGLPVRVVTEREGFFGDLRICFTEGS